MYEPFLELGIEKLAKKIESYRWSWNSSPSKEDAPIARFLCQKLDKAIEDFGWRLTSDCTGKKSCWGLCSYWRREIFGTRTLKMKYAILTCGDIGFFDVRVHEVAHLVMHRNDRGTYSKAHEVEAQSVAALVLFAKGFDDFERSAAYIHGSYAKTPIVLRRESKRIMEAAQIILAAIDGRAPLRQLEAPHHKEIARAKSRLGQAKSLFNKLDIADRDGSGGIYWKGKWYYADEKDSVVWELKRAQREYDDLVSTYETQEQAATKEAVNA